MNRMEQLMDFYRENPDDPFVRYCIALEHIKSDDPGEAREWFEALINSHPDYVATYYHYGKLMESLQDKDAAVSLYQAGIEVASKAGDLHALSELQNARNEVVNAFDIEFDD
ncbi:MAG: hypothetical protein R2767_08240 [Chitinophagales bacterium]